MLGNRTNRPKDKKTLLTLSSWFWKYASDLLAFLCVPGWCMCASVCLSVCLDAQTAMYNAYTTDLLMTKLFI